MINAISDRICSLLNRTLEKIVKTQNRTGEKLVRKIGPIVNRTVMRKLGGIRRLALNELNFKII